MTQSKGELVALAERCEQATGPDRELDAAIAGALSAYSPLARMAVPHFTASIDAAMTLVPDEYEGMSFVWAKEGRWSLCLYNSDIMAGGKTRALALCAAALKARAHNQSESSND